MFPAPTIEPSLKAYARRCRGIVLGLHMIQDPGHNTSADLTQQRVEFPLKAGHLLRGRLVMEELIKQTHPMGE